MRLKLWGSILLVVGLGVFQCIRSVRYTPTIRIGLNASSGFEYFILAKELKFFEKMKLNVQLIEFGSFSDVQQAFEWGQIHGMVCNLIDVMIIQQKHMTAPSKVILIPSYVKAEGACHVLADKSIQTTHDLKGKLVGCEFESFGGFVLMMALRSVNLTFDDVQTRFADPTSFQTFIEKKKVNAVVAYPPYRDNVLRLTDYHSIYSTADWPKEMKLNVFIMNSLALKQNLRGFRAFIKYWDHLIDWYQRNPKRGNQILSQHLSISESEAEKTFAAVVPLKLREQSSVFTFNKYVARILKLINSELFSKLNLSNREVRFDEIFDESFVHRALLESNESKN